MTHFQWRAQNHEGHICQGECEAQTERDVRQQLREKNLQPLAISIKHRTVRAKTPHLPAAERVLLMRQLATLIGAAVPLEQALTALVEQCEQPASRALLIKIKLSITEGVSLADALAQFPRAFPPLYTTLVAAGEASGHLHDVLQKLADYSENSQRIQRKLIQSMVYPLLLLLVAVVVVTLLLTTVVPQVVEQFVYMRQQLPLSTRLLMALSEWVKIMLLPLLITSLLAAAVIRQALQAPARRLRFHHWLLRLPLLGNIIKGLALARYSQTLSILVLSAVPLLDSMKISSRVVGNLALHQQLLAAADRVREGESLSAALQALRLLSPMMRHMIASGEESGELDIMLKRAADTQEQQFLSSLTLALSLFEPLLVVTMAGVVLFIIVAILQPLLQLNTLIG